MRRLTIIWARCEHQSSDNGLGTLLSTAVHRMRYLRPTESWYALGTRKLEEGPSFMVGERLS